MRNWRLLVLKQELESYEFYQKQIAECDKVIEGLYEGFDKQNTDELSNNKKKKNKNTPNFNARKSLYNTLASVIIVNKKILTNEH